MAQPASMTNSSTYLVDNVSGAGGQASNTLNLGTSKQLK